MKILITGGVGFIGSHLCHHFINQGHKVICLDNFASGDISNIRSLVANNNFKFFQANICDDKIKHYFNGVDIVIHLAAQIHVDKSEIEPNTTYNTNVMGTLNILKLCRQYDVKKMIYASTSEVYGTAQTNPMNENHPLDAPHPYGASKTAADRMCYAYAKTFGMNVVIVRSFNLYGPKQKASGYGGVISLFTNKCLKGMPPLIYGSGDQRRDYLYVKDIVNAYDLITHSKKDLGGEAFNFGTGKSISINELAHKILALFNSDTKPKHVEARPGEVNELICDYSKATELLGWKPEYSFDRGLAEFVDWYKNYQHEQWSKGG